MIYSKEVENMCIVAKGPNHGPAPLPEEPIAEYTDEFIHSPIFSELIIFIYV